MDQHQNPEEATESGKEHLRAAAGDIKKAVSAKVEDIRQTAADKTDEFREAAQGKAQELSGAMEAPGQMADPRRRPGWPKAKLTFATIRPRLSL